MSLKDYCHIIVLRALVIVYIFCQKLKTDVKKSLFASISVRISKNKQRFANELFVIKRIIKSFSLGVPDKMADTSKLSPQCNGVTVIL